MDAPAPQDPRWPLTRRQRALLWHHLAALSSRGRLAPDLRLLARSGLGNAGFARHLDAIALRLEAGESLSAAVAALDVSFDGADIAVVRAGERSGRLPETLRAWAHVEHRRARAAAAMLSACILPLVTLSCLAMATWIVAWKVMPTMKTILVEAGLEAPFATRLALASFDVAPLAGSALAFAVIALGLAWLFPERVPGAIRRVLHRGVLAIPGVGACSLAATRWMTCEALASFVAAGLPPSEALRAAAAMQRNEALAAELDAAAADLDAGGRLAGATPSRALDASLRHGLDAALARDDAPLATSRLARRQHLQLDRSVRRLVAVVPGLATLAIGLLAGVVVVGIYAVLFAPASGLP